MFDNIRHIFQNRIDNSNKRRFLQSLKYKIFSYKKSNHFNFQNKKSHPKLGQLFQKNSCVFRDNPGLAFN